MNKKFFLIVAILSIPYHAFGMAEQSPRSKECNEIMAACLEPVPGKILFNPYKFEDYLAAHPRVPMHAIHQANMSMTDLINKQADLTREYKIIDVILLQGEVIRVMEERNKGHYKPCSEKTIKSYRLLIAKLFSMGESNGMSPETGDTVVHFLKHRWNQCHCDNCPAPSTN